MITMTESLSPMVCFNFLYDSFSDPYFSEGKDPLLVAREMAKRGIALVFNGS